MIDGLNDVLLVLVTASSTITASVVAQILVGRQKRSNFFKKKSWDQLLQLVTSLSKLSNHLHKVLKPWSRTNVNLEIVHECFQEMIVAQPYIYLTGRNDVVKAFLELYFTLEFIESHASQPSWSNNVKARYNKLPGQTVSLIRRISSFMGC